MKDTCVYICQQLRRTDSVRPTGNPEWKLSSRDKSSLEDMMSINTSKVVVTRNHVLYEESMTVEYNDMELYLQ